MATINVYLERLPARYAEIKMLLADVVALPHMKDSQRNSLIRKWKKDIERYEPEVIRPASPAVLRMMGIGVKHVE